MVGEGGGGVRGLGKKSQIFLYHGRFGGFFQFGVTKMATLHVY
jgi:hypothetical protein